MYPNIPVVSLQEAPKPDQTLRGRVFKTRGNLTLVLKAFTGSCATAILILKNLQRFAISVSQLEFLESFLRFYSYTFYFS